MDLRITEERRGDVSVVQVAGRLSGEGVEELGATCRSAAGRGRLRLDLSALLQADEVGLALLRSLREAGTELAGASPFIQLLLEGKRSDPV